MYIPSNTKMESTREVHNFIDEFSFGVVVSEPLFGTHLPFILNKDEGEFGTLYGHFAKANSHWKNLNAQEVMVIFSGPHAYISPTWYATPPAVPTWNYAAVHVYGVVEILDKAQTLEVVEKTINKYESSLLVNRDIVTNEFRDQLLGAIVGFKVTILRVEGKLKLGQHRKSQDQKGVVAGLQSSNDRDSLGLVNYMLRKGVGVGR